MASRTFIMSTVVMPAAAYALLGLVPARATTVGKIGGDTPDFDSKWGVVEGETVFRLCKSHRVFVGTVTDVVETYRFNGDVYSRAKVVVDADIADTITETNLTLNMSGGQYKGNWYSYEGMPEPRVGTQYLLGLSYPSNPPENWPPNHQATTFASFIAPGTPMPSEAELQAEHIKMCEARAHR